MQCAFKWQQLAIPPHAALVRGHVAHPPLAPRSFDRRGIRNGVAKMDFEKTAASWAIVEYAIDCESGTALRLEANQVARHLPSVCRGLRRNLASPIRPNPRVRPARRDPVERRPRADRPQLPR